MIPIPSKEQPMVGDDRKTTLPWWFFLSQLYPIKAAPEVSITVGTSPFAYTTQDRGFFIITGGTVSSITLTRTTSHSTGITSGYFPVGRGDVLTITYTVAPTVNFFPT